MGLTQVSGSARAFNYEARSTMTLPFLFNSRSGNLGEMPKGKDLKRKSIREEAKKTI
jgi:hypothetical protein